MTSTVSAAQSIATKLAGNTTVNDHDRWRDQFSTVMQALAPVVEFAEDTRTDRRHQTPELQAARDAWMHVYVASRSIVEGILRLQGKLHLLPTIYYDLAVTPSTELKNPPPDPPPEPPTDDEDDDA